MTADDARSAIAIDAYFRPRNNNNCYTIFSSVGGWAGVVCHVVCRQSSMFSRKSPEPAPMCPALCPCAPPLPLRAESSEVPQVVALLVSVVVQHRTLPLGSVVPTVGLIENRRVRFFFDLLVVAATAGCSWTC